MKLSQTKLSIYNVDGVSIFLDVVQLVYILDIRCALTPEVRYFSNVSYLDIYSWLLVLKKLMKNDLFFKRIILNIVRFVLYIYIFSHFIFNMSHMLNITC